ncbi:MAG TPA: alpha/beta hydrolase [Candidatus Binataceae bacterium]|nr:alpha/beta hydrolase [Candidatus Binataceae bacterium]
MLTDKEKAIVDAWNEFATQPRSDVNKRRRDLEEFCERHGWNANPPAIGALHQNVELRAGLNADIAVPKGNGPHRPHPVALYLHGGAWMSGSAETHRKLGMRFAEQGYLTINLNYRLAPENQFPAGFDDCLFAAKWAAQNAGRWNGDSSRMLMAGDSAGANLTAAVLVALSNDSNAPKFRAAGLIYGVFDFPSLIERSPARAPVEDLARLYLGGHYPEALKDARVSPLRAIKAGALPPCFVICGTADALLPESRLVASALREAGIECDLQEIDDMPHAFMNMEDLAGCREGHRMMFDFLHSHV